MSRSEIVGKRSDMSTYLVHWTTHYDFDAIIRSGFLVPDYAARWYDIYHGEGKRGRTIYGPRPAVCFSEMPIGNWIQSITAYYPYSDQRWGIAIPKRILYAYGARPILYIHKPVSRPKCPEEELWHKCPDEEKFRLCSFRYIPKPDWTHEREWRVCANGELNDRIGLKSDRLVHSYRRKGNQLIGDRTVKKSVKGDSLVPIHLPGLNKGELDSVLSDAPHFVLVVETEEDKEKVKQFPPPPVVRAIAQRYSSIGEYRDKYLAALQKAHVISLEYARDARDRLGLWSLEELLSSRRPHRIAVLWDKARTETRRQALDLIGEEGGRGYEYYCGHDLWNILPQSLLQPTQSVGKRIEECEQAIEILRDDVKAWVHKVFEGVM